MHRIVRTTLWTLGGLAASGLALRARRAAEDRRADRLERDLFAASSALPRFTEALVADRPEPVRRYLRHAIAPGTPLAPAVRLAIEGTMTPTPGGAPVELTADEVLAPRRGFVWTARARMFGLPVHVRDHYVANDGGVRVHLLGLIPLPLSAAQSDVARSSRGRLVGEAVWCPTALVGPGVMWEAIDADRARFTLRIDSEDVAVTLRIDTDGALRDVTLDRWGDVGVDHFQRIPYGFAVESERTFDGVTIPTRIRGGWWYGTDRYDATAASSFVITAARFAEHWAARGPARTG
jgi:hypothetical protein